MVDDLEGSVRRMLDFCGLIRAGLPRIPQDRTQRAHRELGTGAPADFPRGLDQWKHYEPWLGPLKEALGDALTSYR